MKKIAKILGYELLKIKKHPSLNYHLINLISFYKIDTIFDVGANNGQFGLSLRKNGYKGKIYSFEPVIKTFENLVSASSFDANWHVYNMALGDTISKAVINVSKSSDLSSMLEANHFGQEKYPNMEISRQETIEVNTLDNFIVQNNLQIGRKILLKMDTQGFDLKVFNGAKKSIPSIFCLLSEISLIPIYSNMPHYLDALRAYEESGFQISGLYPISRNKQNLSIIEMDCALVNKNV